VRETEAGRAVTIDEPVLSLLTGRSLPQRGLSMIKAARCFGLHVLTTPRGQSAVSKGRSVCEWHGNHQLEEKLGCSMC